MNKLDTKARATILQLLCEGQSVRAVAGRTGASKNTVAKLLSDAGAICAEYQDRVLRKLNIRRVQVDTIWSFDVARLTNVRATKAPIESPADCWTWSAMDVDSRLVLSWLVGRRDSDCAITFMDDLRGRLANRVRFTSDGAQATLEAVDGAFWGGGDEAMLIKIYGAASESKGRHNPAERIGAKKGRMETGPDFAHVSMSHAEPENLIVRMAVRYAQPPDAYHKKVENHAHAVALHFIYHNFVRLHANLHSTPAMAAGIAKKIWEIGDIVALTEA